MSSEVGFPTASSGGLTCFINKLQAQMSNRTVLYMSNPMTKTWKELPRFLCKERPLLVSVIMSKRPSHYKVIVAGEAGSTEIFDSVEGEWRNSRPLPPGEEVPRNTVVFYNGRVYHLSSNVTFCNGSLNCLTELPSHNDLLVFRIQDKMCKYVWSKVEMGRLPSYHKFRNLVTCKGHIMIVSKPIDKTTKWREKGHMPQDISDHFLRFLETKFSCCSHRDLIFLTSETCNMGLLFDTAQNMWRWVVNYPNLDRFSFEPCLDSQM